MTEPPSWAAPDSGRPEPARAPGPPPPYPPTPNPRPGWAGPPYGGPAGWVPPPPAPRPGVIPLRPLGVGEILDGAITYVRVNPMATLGLSAVVITVTQLIQVPAQALYLDSLLSLGTSSSSDPLDALAGVIGGSLTAGSVGWLLSFVAITMLTGMLIAVLSQAVLGRRATLGEAWAQVRPRVLGLLGLSLLVVLILLTPAAVAVVVVLIAVLLVAPTWVPVLLGIVLGIAAVCATVFIATILSMAAPAYVLETIGATAALRRSARLVRPQFWRVLGIQLLAALIALVLGGIITVPFSAAAGLITGSNAATGGDPFAATLPALLLGAVGAIIATTLTAPFQAGVTGLLYVDQRIRREGLDIDLARAAQGPQ